MTTRHITRRILLPLDGGKLSISALPFLRTLITPESEVLLLRVVPDVSPLMRRLPGRQVEADDVHQQAVRTCEAYLDDVGDGLKGICSQLTTLTRVGHPADEILNVSEEMDVDLILMATHGHGAVGRMMLGSVADRVARSAMMPVMLFRPHPVTRPLSADLDVGLQRVVVPTDGSDHSLEALPVAKELASRLSASIHLVRAISLDDYLDLEVDALGREYSALLDSASALQTTIREELQEHAAPIREEGITATVDVLIGPAASSISEAMTPGDLLVMTSHGEGGVRRWLVGSVAEKLMQQSVAPLVLVPNPDRAPIVACQREAQSPA
jgi:nucleotide-binding universal stress UspA family protein